MIHFFLSFQTVERDNSREHEPLLFYEKRDAPTVDEITQLLQQHTAYAQQLEAENRYTKVGYTF